MNYKYCSADEAVKLINSNSRVFLHGGAATPTKLIDALFRRAGQITNVELVSISMLGLLPWNTPAIREHFFLNSLFVSDNVREWVGSNSGDYTPVFLSEIPRLFQQGILAPDVAMVQVSPPDAHGFCSLGTSADVAVSAMRCAGKVIALVNPRMPRIMGDGAIPFSRFDAAVYESCELPEVTYQNKSNTVTNEIGRRVAELIENGATLQMGIGAIPDAVLKFLSNHQDLGVHTEMFSDGIIPLIESGVITNRNKKVRPGLTVSSFVIGTRKLYDFVNDNPAVMCMDVAYVNATDVIRRNPKVSAINSAIEVDLTGQVCADSIGTLQYSGIGGQMDFMRGAALSEGGKPIIALPSTTRDGASRIVPFLHEGAGVVTTRGHIHYVVTEYGAVNLYGRTMEQRAKLLTSIAHPMHRETLDRARIARFGK